MGRIVSYPEGWPPVAEGGRSLRVLVVRFGALGDVIQSLPVVHRLAELVPKPEITYVTAPGPASLLASDPHLTRLLEFDKFGHDAGRRGTLAFGRRLREYGFDLFVDLQPSLRTLAFWSYGGRPRWMSHKYHPSARGIKREQNLHAVSHFLLSLEKLGISPTGDERPKLFVTPEERLEAEDLLRQSLGGTAGGRVVAISPFVSNNGTNRLWPPESFRELTRLLVQEGLKVVLCHHPSNREQASEYAEVGSEVACLELDLRSTAAVFSLCSLLVSVETGLVHVAEAVNLPVVSILGAFPPSRVLSRSDFSECLFNKNHACVPCYESQGCPYHRKCMDEITPREVFEKALAVLSRSGAREVGTQRRNETRHYVSSVGG